MSTTRISQLPELPSISSNTSNTLFLGVDMPTGTTGKFTATTLAQQLYANNALAVGNNLIVFSNTVAQFSGYDESFLQVNMQNFQSNGSGDYVITGDKGTNSNNYINLGLNGSQFEVNYTVGDAFLPNDGYLYIQGPGEENVGNLIIGAVVTGTETRFIAGGANTEHVVAKISESGLTFENGQGIIFEDGTTLSSNSELATTTILSAANTFLQANDASTLAVAKAYTDTANTYAQSYTDSKVGTANTFLQANDASTLAVAKAYTDTANNYLVSFYNTGPAFIQANSAYNQANLAYNHANTAVGDVNVLEVEVDALTTLVFGIGDTANNALANTTGTFGGNLTIAGRANVSQQLMIANSTYDYANVALVRITGSAGDVYQPPAQPGYMLAVTGVDGVASRIINTGYGTGAYGLYAGRHARGTAGAPIAVANNDVIARFSGGGYNGSEFTSTGQGRIDIVADEDFSVANTGSRIEFYNTIPQTNTITKIASFNANTATFTGTVYPNKGFIYTPRVIAGNTTSIVIDFASDSMVKATCIDACTVSFTNYTPGKIVELWVTNLSGSTHTFTHGCTALNATNNATTKSVPSTSSLYLRYFSIDGDLANTFVTITQG